MARKNAKGSGSIRQRPDGVWEGRFTYVDSLGVKRRKSVYAKTQRECRKKLTAVLTEVDNNTYKEPQRMTVAEWLTLWVTTYCAELKPRTVSSYRSTITTRIVPYIGSVQLNQLNNINVQQFINTLKQQPSKNGGTLSAKTVLNTHGVLHKALEQAVASRVINANPADGVKLPKKEKPQITPLMDDAVCDFIKAIQGDKYELVFLLALLSGLRQSEILGLRWADIDLSTGEIAVVRQLQRNYGRGADDPHYIVTSPKNGKGRNVVIPKSLSALLRKWQAEQAALQLAAGPLWDNPDNYVFTDAIGHHLAHSTVRKHFKAAVASIGRPEVRFHDLRHSYATNALQSGDSIKAVQEQLGHYSSAFTMDVYADVSKQMRQESQARMEAFFRRAKEG